MFIFSNTFLIFARQMHDKIIIANYAPYLNSNRVSLDGFTLLYVRYNYNRSRRTLIATGYSIKPVHWDDKKKWVKRACPQFEEIDMVLTRITSKLGEILSHAKDNGIDPIVDFILLE